MKLFYTILFFTFCYVAIRYSAKFLLSLINKSQEKNKSNSNPYIAYHKSKMENDKNYDEYIEWLDENGNGVPVDKVKSPEDVKAEKKINQLFR